MGENGVAAADDGLCGCCHYDVIKFKVNLFLCMLASDNESVVVATGCVTPNCVCDAKNGGWRE